MTPSRARLHPVLDLLHSKTEVGRAEIRARALPLSRAARNLLLVLDASKPAGEWLRLVTGATEADLEALRQQGLIVPQGGWAPPGTVQPPPAQAQPPVAPPTAAPAPSAAAPLPVGVSPLLDRAALYTYMSGQATRLLGRCSPRVAAIALANKIGRTARALMTSGGRYREPGVA